MLDDVGFSILVEFWCLCIMIVCTVALWEECLSPSSEYLDSLSNWSESLVCLERMGEDRIHQSSYLQLALSSSADCLPLMHSTFAALSAESFKR